MLIGFYGDKIKMVSAGIVIYDPGIKMATTAPEKVILICLICQILLICSVLIN